MHCKNEKGSDIFEPFRSCRSCQVQNLILHQWNPFYFDVFCRFTLLFFTGTAAASFASNLAECTSALTSFDSFKSSDFKS